MNTEQKARKFVAEVLEHLVAEQPMKERIENDLYYHIMEAAKTTDIDSFLQQMGSPQEVAGDFMETYYDSTDDVNTLQKILQTKSRPSHHPAPPPPHHHHPGPPPPPPNHPAPPPPPHHPGHLPPPVKKPEHTPLHPAPIDSVKKTNSEASED